MEEVWKYIDGFEGLYQVSNFGRIKSIPRRVRCQHYSRMTKERIMKQHSDHLGYCRVSLHKGLKQYSPKVHRLVGIAFIPNPNNYREINHKDENPSNNRVDNLEWCDHLYNSRYGNRGKKLSIANTNNPMLCKRVAQYTKDGKFVKEYNSIREVFKQTGIHNGSITMACKGQIKTAGGFVWKYV